MLPLTPIFVAKVEVPGPCTVIGPPKYELPVVVAPPLIVRPPVCVPSPIVLDAYAVRPPLNCVSVEVALPASWKGYAEEMLEVRLLGVT